MGNPQRLFQIEATNGVYITNQSCESSHWSVKMDKQVVPTGCSRPSSLAPLKTRLAYFSRLSPQRFWLSTSHRLQTP